MSYKWTDPEDEIEYTVTPEGAVLAYEAELRPFDPVPAVLAREILRLAERDVNVSTALGDCADKLQAANAREDRLAERVRELEERMVNARVGHNKRVAALEAENAALRENLALLAAANHIDLREGLDRVQPEVVESDIRLRVVPVLFGTGFWVAERGNKSAGGATQAEAVHGLREIERGNS